MITDRNENQIIIEETKQEENQVENTQISPILDENEFERVTATLNDLIINTHERYNIEMALKTSTDNLEKHKSFKAYEEEYLPAQFEVNKVQVELDNSRKAIELFPQGQFAKTIGITEDMDQVTIDALFTDSYERLQLTYDDATEELKAVKSVPAQERDLVLINTYGKRVDALKKSLAPYKTYETHKTNLKKKLKDLEKAQNKLQQEQDKIKNFEQVDALYAANNAAKTIHDDSTRTMNAQLLRINNFINNLSNSSLSVAQFEKVYSLKLELESTLSQNFHISNAIDLFNHIRDNSILFNIDKTIMDLTFVLKSQINEHPESLLQEKFLLEQQLKTLTKNSIVMLEKDVLNIDGNNITINDQNTENLLREMPGKRTYLLINENDNERIFKVSDKNSRLKIKEIPFADVKRNPFVKTKSKLFHSITNNARLLSDIEQFIFDSARYAKYNQANTLHRHKKSHSRFLNLHLSQEETTINNRIVEIEAQIKNEKATKINPKRRPTLFGFISHRLFSSNSSESEHSGQIDDRVSFSERRSSFFSPLNLGHGARPRQSATAEAISEHSGIVDDRASFSERRSSFFSTLNVGARRRQSATAASISESINLLDIYSAETNKDDEKFEHKSSL